MAALRFRAEVLRAARAHAGLTQRQVAEQVGLRSGERVSAWEHEMDTPSAVYVPRLALALGVSPFDLYDVDASSPPFAALRFAAGLSLRALSDTAGVPYTTCQRIDGGRTNPPKAVAAALASALGVRPATVLAAVERTRIDRQG